MTMRFRSPGVRPGLSIFLQVSLTSSLLLTVAGAHAQAPCTGSPYSGQTPSILLAGQSCTYTIPTSQNPPTYYGGVAGPNGPVTATNTSGTNTYVTQPLTSGRYSFDLTTLTGRGGDSLVITSFPVFQANGSSPRSLIGQYSFQVSGKTAEQTSSRLVAAAGSFTADGKGNITAGVIDIHSPAGIVTGQSVTGTYQVNAYGIGVVNLATSLGTLQFTLASQPLTASVTQTESASGGSGAFGVTFPIVEGGTIATTAGGLASASGTFVQAGVPDIELPGFGFQLPYAQRNQPATLDGSFYVNLAGQAESGAALTGAARFRFAAAGTVTADVTTAGNGTLTSLPGWTGTYTPFDPTTGRSVLTLTDPSQLNAPKQMFSVYETQQGATLYLVSIASGQATGLLSGRADQF